jgi:uncharacterized protein
MAKTFPSALQGRKYIALTTFRKNGVGVATPVWFAESDQKLYLFTNPRSGKVKRIRTNAKVKIAPSTMRGKVIGPEVAGKARFLDGQERAQARKVLERKYWLMRVPFLWSKDSVFLEIELD